MRSAIPFIETKIAMDTSGLTSRSFLGTLKQIRPDENEPMVSIVMQLAFPHFRDVSEMCAKAQRFFRKLYGEEAYSALSTKPRRRRFSGGDILPRGRYYTVCSDYSEPLRSSQTPRLHDGNVLLQELLAYSNDPVNGPMFLLDYQGTYDRVSLNRLGLMTDLELSSGASHEVDSWNKIAVCFKTRQGCPSLIDVLMDEIQHDPDFNIHDYGRAIGGAIAHVKAATPSDELSSVQIVNLYYKLEKVQIDKVVDLRYPDTQRSFINVFFPELRHSVLQEDVIKVFSKCLPSLIATPLGGTELTDRIGTFLMATGANALIYPSARYNSFVRFKSGKLEEHGGWNLVDYRNIQRPEIPDLSCKVTCAQEKRIRVEIPVVSEDFGSGSWRIHGVLKQSVASSDNLSLQVIEPSGTQEHVALSHDESELVKESLRSHLQACSGKQLAADPVSSAQSIIAIGDRCIQKGIVDEAISCFEKSLDVLEGISYDLEPSLVERTRSIAYERLGDCLIAQARPKDAVAYFSECLKIRILLYGQYATSQTSKDLGVAYSRLGAALVGDAQVDKGVLAHVKSAQQYESLIRAEGIEYENMEILGCLAIAYLNIALCFRKTDPEIFMDRMIAAYGLADELVSRGDLQVMQNKALCAFRQKVEDGIVPYEWVRKAKHAILNELRSGDFNQTLSVKYSRLACCPILFIHEPDYP